MDVKPYTLTMESISYLSTARKWAMFLAIIGFIAVALLVLMGIFMGFFFSAVEIPQEFSTGASAFSVVFSIAYIIIAIIYFIPVWFLFQFSRKVKQALEINDTEVLTESFRNLKNYFLAYGVLTILAIILYAIFTMIGLFTAVGTMGSMAV